MRNVGGEGKNQYKMGKENEKWEEKGVSGDGLKTSIGKERKNWKLYLKKWLFVTSPL